ncbi:DUF3397 family protein [Lactobacillus sp. PV034]|uniref:DUF3397 family protein n=1 Tax=Lactobacillus sp. PV034 TaxID=2594495 RepID=UPI00223EBDC2|nr:DUF3397 family protein [Lactobacillus sp. PV034]QNQ80615.1 DUF3397 domain-containing protein [Lactobacillus sp. PV034]
MQIIWIFLLPILGLLLDALIVKVFPKAKFKGYDILPLFFIPACQLLTTLKHKPSFLPYGFLFYFILILIVTIKIAVQNKNISMKKTLRQLWDYLIACSVFWYVGLFIVVLL